VRSVIVDGVEVVGGGRPTRVDLDALMSRVDRRARELLRVLDYSPPAAWRSTVPA
jgi:hypothetical protein